VASRTRGAADGAGQGALAGGSSSRGGAGQVCALGAGQGARPGAWQGVQARGRQRAARAEVGGEQGRGEQVRQLKVEDRRRIFAEMPF
jgi:hypothetical protein